MKDLAKIGLPLQVAGFLVMTAGFTHLPALQAGLVVHLAGDVLFFLAMKKKGCL